MESLLCTGCSLPLKSYLYPYKICKGHSDEWMLVILLMDINILNKKSVIFLIHFYMFWKEN